MQKMFCFADVCKLKWLVYIRNITIDLYGVANICKLQENINVY